jgi:hypothetical protein
VAAALRACAATALAAALVALAPACDGEPQCPAETEELSPAEADLYRQLEVCASRVTGVALHRDELPRVERDPERVECSKNPTGTCVTTPAGQPVSGYYLRACDTISAVAPAVLYHELMHPVLCGVPGLDCDPGHQSPAWVACLGSLQQCPDGRLLIGERVCDGTADCAEGEDERGCS